MSNQRKLDDDIIAKLADQVMHAQDNAHTITKLTNDYPDMTVEDGYAVQWETRRRWIARGQRQSGIKAGLTSKAKMEQMGVHVPGFGFLMSDFARPENGVVRMDELVHPRIEAEVAFVMDKELSGEDCTIEQVLAATDYVIPALEVIDSRFEKFKFDLESVIADNSSSARYITGGRPLNVDQIDDLRTIGVVIEKNGEIAELGASAAVLNHPANAIIEVVKHLARHGESLPAGSFVMTGGITAAIPVAAGDNIVARYQNMGSVSVRFV